MLHLEHVHLAKACGALQEEQHRIPRFVNRHRPLQSKGKYEVLTKLTETMLQLQLQKQQTKLSSQLERLEHRIAHTDNAINQKVYQLYDLTEQEIKTVEEK